MFINEEDKNKILERSENKLLEIIGSFGELQHKGASYYASCPKCNSTKSLTITPAKGLFKCFKCNQLSGKRPIDYLMHGHGYSFPDGLKYIADNLGIIILEPTPITKPKKGVSKKDSFCAAMLKESGLTKDDITARSFKQGDTSTIFKSKTFTSGSITTSGEIDEKGDDVIIRYFDLDGLPVTYESKDNKGRKAGSREYFRVRYKYPEEHKDKNGRAAKYRSPYGASSIIYIPQVVRALYNNKKQIDRLFIQEGEKKAEKACKHGIVSLGIAGIQNLGYKGQLPECIAQIVETCQVKEVVFLVDSDCFDITSHIKITDSIDRRPKNFFYAVKNFKEYFNILKNRDIFIDVFFGHVRKNEAGDKGVDDLLTNTLKGKEDALLSDINSAINLKDMIGEYVQLHKITTMSDSKLLQIWSLHSPHDFCKLYYEQLKDLPEFLFGRHKWRFNEDKQLETAQPLEDDEKFWDEDLKTSRAGVDYKTYNFKYTRCFKFLQNRGFGRFRKINGEFDFIQINNPFVRTVTHLDVRDFLTEFCKTYASEDVLDMIYKGGPQYVGPDKLSNLEYKLPIFEKPIRGQQRLYFKNSVWDISNEEIKEFKHEQLNYNIWQDQINDFSPTILPPLFTIKKVDGKFSFELTNIGKSCHFLQFLINSSNFSWRKEDAINKGGTADISDEEKYEDDVHLIAKLCAIGFLTSSAKDRNIAKAVIGLDGKQSEIGISNGRSGKSLIGELMRKIVVTKYTNGKTIDLIHDKFPWEGMTEKTKLVFIDDVKRDFNFELIFANITGDWHVNCKGEKQFDIQFEESPKIYLTNNHAMKGEGSSFTDRQWQLAFSDYYNEEHKPLNDFGCMFFSEWDYAQWNLCWNMVAQCVRTFFTYGCIESPGERLEKRKFRAEATEEFISWADEYFSNTNHINEKLIRKEMYDALLTYIPEQQKKYYTAQTFKFRLQSYCKLKDLLFNPHKLDPLTKKPCFFSKTGEPVLEDKSNGIEYFIIGDTQFFENYHVAPEVEMNTLFNTDGEDEDFEEL